MKDFREELKNIRWVGRTDISEFFTIAIKLKKRRKKRMCCSVRVEENKILLNDGGLDKEFELGKSILNASSGEFGILKDVYDDEENWDAVRAFACELLECLYKDELTIMFMEEEKRANGGELIKDSHEQLTDCTKRVRKEIQRYNDRLVVYDCFEDVAEVKEFLEIDLYYAVQNGMQVEKCHRCSKFFAPKTRSSVLCSEKCIYESAKANSAALIKNDENLAQYEKIRQSTYYYLRHTNKRSKIKAIKEILKAMQKMRMQYKKGELNPKQFIEMLNAEKEKARIIAEK